MEGEPEGGVGLRQVDRGVERVCVCVCVDELHESKAKQIKARQNGSAAVGRRLFLVK